MAGVQTFRQSNDSAVIHLLNNQSELRLPFFSSSFLAPPQPFDCCGVLSSFSSDATHHARPRPVLDTRPGPAKLGAPWGRLLRDDPLDHHRIRDLRARDRRG